MVGLSDYMLLFCTGEVLEEFQKAWFTEIIEHDYCIDHFEYNAANQLIKELKYKYFHWIKFITFHIDNGRTTQCILS